MVNDRRTLTEVERLRAAAALRQSEQRQAFLLALSDALRPLRDPGEIEREAARLLGEHLGVAAVLFTHLFADAAEVTSEFSSGDLPSFLGRYGFDTWSTPAEMLRRGQAFVAADADTALITQEERERWQRYGISSAAAVPIVRQGATLASLTVSDLAPRPWSGREVEFFQEVADRTWTAVERALAEEQLRESEARRQLALDAAGMGTFVWHPQEDFCVADPRMLELFGLGESGTLNLAEALGKRIHPADRERYAAAVGKAIEPGGGGRLDEEIRVLHSDGSLHWVAVRGQTVFAGKPGAAAPQMYGIASEVTERKLRQANQQFLSDLDRRLGELGKAEALEQTAIDALGAFLEVSRCYFAHIEQQEEARIEREYRAAATSVSVIASHRFADYFSPEALEEYAGGCTFAVADVATDPRTAPSAEAYAALDIRAFISSSVFYQGEWVAIISATDREPRRWREDQLELLRELAARVYPMIERARAEKALRDSEARLATVFAALPVGAGYSDPQGQLVFANLEMQRYLPQGVVPSLDPKAAVRWQAWHPDGKKVERHEFAGARALAGETVVPGLEMLHTQEDGKQVWTRVSAVPHRDEEGKILGFFTVVADIDALKRAQEKDGSEDG